MERENDDLASLLEIPEFLKVTPENEVKRAERWAEFYRKEREEKGPTEAEPQRTITDGDGRVWILPGKFVGDKMRRRKSSNQMKDLKRLGWKGTQLAKLSPVDAYGVISRHEEPPPRERKKRGRKKKREVLLPEREVLHERPKRRREVLID